MNREEQIIAAFREVHAGNGFLSHEETEDFVSRVSHNGSFDFGFYYGARWADTHPQSPWISVDDNPPELGKDNESPYMLVSSSLVPGMVPICAKYIKISYLVRWNHKSVLSNWIKTDGSYIHVPITHYMPLPGLGE